MSEAHHETMAPDGFRLRGTAMSRVDAFSDVVFGFALTLLVVSLEVPKTYTELHALLLGFFPFAISFSFLIMVWFAHFRLFRRYGLHNHATVVVNAALLFVVLFYVYPMKFLSTLLAGQDKPDKLFSDYFQVRELMVVYGLGFAAVYLLLAALYWIGWLHRDELELNSLERTLTWVWITDNVGVGCIGLISVAVAYLLPLQIAGLSGFAYFLIIVFKTAHGTVAGRITRRVRAEYEHLQALAMQAHRAEPLAHRAEARRIRLPE